MAFVYWRICANVALVGTDTQRCLAKPHICASRVIPAPEEARLPPCISAPCKKLLKCKVWLFIFVTLLVGTDTLALVSRPAYLRQWANLLHCDTLTGSPNNGNKAKERDYYSIEKCHFFTALLSITMLNFLIVFLISNFTSFSK